jgi:twitching motility protein PilT
MQTMNQSLLKALKSKLITLEDALRISPEPEELKRMIQATGAK